MSLKLYNKKRDFEKTPEPVAVKVKKGKALKFVVHRHNASHLHYDFRLEMDGVLKSWAIPKGPSMKAGERRLAVMVEDHPLSYGKFYGSIPENNYGAGTVEIFDNGTYIPLTHVTGISEEKNLLDQLKKGDVKFILKGKYLKGGFVLILINDGLNKNWLLIKKKDEWASKEFNIEKLKPVKTKVRSVVAKKSK